MNRHDETDTTLNSSKDNEDSSKTATAFAPAAVLDWNGRAHNESNGGKNDSRECSIGISSADGNRFVVEFLP